MQHDRTIARRAEHDFHDANGNRLFLFVLRRMAAAGVNDAHAANALFGHFGKGYRRPLVLMRAMMLEIARASGRRISVAPCCCTRLTADEGLLMQAMGVALSDPAGAYRLMATLLSTDAALGALTCAQAVSQAYADMGRPIGLYTVE